MAHFTPPPGAQSIAEVLEEARTHLDRLSASDLLLALQHSPQPIHLIDIRPAQQRLSEGPLIFPLDLDHSSAGHGIWIIERNVLEWRLDPQSDARMTQIVDVDGYETKVVIVCSEGYTSSLAARALQRLGLARATDLVGGFWAWKKLLEG